mmetsp:Transcript_13825/g.14950  ORF Transcript_13825/g.14950 Transcript_13825/m.14950 type:complete len:111 (-) Transcript_13825:1315-1647(-)
MSSTIHDIFIWGTFEPAESVITILSPTKNKMETENDGGSTKEKRLRKTKSEIRGNVTKKLRRISDNTVNRKFKITYIIWSSCDNENDSLKCFSTCWTKGKCASKDHCGYW